jgi:hypothetical protein
MAHIQTSDVHAGVQEFDQSVDGLGVGDEGTNNLFTLR